MTNYQKIGDGKKVLIFLPGWGDSAQTFAQLVGKLSSGYTILILDLPGFGGTQAADEAWNLDDYGNFIVSWLKKIGVNDIYALIGHSNGGGIAIRSIARGILKPQKLILMASAGVRNTHKIRKFLLKTVAKTGKIITMPIPVQARKNIRSKLYSGLGSDAGLYPQMEGTFRKVISQDVQADASSIKIPTLLIYGSLDKSTPLSYGKIFHKQIDGSDLKIVDGAGHYLHQEKTEEVANLLNDFLKDIK